MRKAPTDQLRLDIPEPEETPRRRRSKRVRVPALPKTDRQAPQRAEQTAAMLQNPEVSRCGFCGRRLTILEEVAICPSCGSIVSRAEDD